MSKWQVKVQVWPYSSGEGATKDQAKVGDEWKQIEFEAEHVSAALVIGKIYLAGIRTNPAVWEANITSLEKVQ